MDDPGLYLSRSRHGILSLSTRDFEAEAEAEAEGWQNNLGRLALALTSRDPGPDLVLAPMGVALVARLHSAPREEVLDALLSETMDIYLGGNSELYKMNQLGSMRSTTGISRSSTNP